MAAKRIQYSAAIRPGQFCKSIGQLEAPSRGPGPMPAPKLVSDRARQAETRMHPWLRSIYTAEAYPPAPQIGLLRARLQALRTHEADLWALRGFDGGHSRLVPTQLFGHFRCVIRAALRRSMSGILRTSARAEARSLLISFTLFTCSVPFAD